MGGGQAFSDWSNTVFSCHRAKLCAEDLKRQIPKCRMHKETIQNFANTKVLICCRLRRWTCSAKRQIIFLEGVKSTYIKVLKCKLAPLCRPMLKNVNWIFPQVFENWFRTVVL